MMDIILILSTMCFVFAAIAIYLLICKMVSDEMLESKDRIIMDLQEQLQGKE